MYHRVVAIGGEATARYRVTPEAFEGYSQRELNLVHTQQVVRL
jgi:hypothetical protein